ncbi:MAG: tRNA (N6-isopentenyl adenosine(37)-C2)-methylthiotransferase MiaB [Bacteroidales bacterium]|nr:tRNA (N6-isopentenyl adenosine(37)-C2)-methylthiotransferase MiaB [Bacteroidales bacterium]MBP3254734.1 tRNA (N6-isopentenyl adenosine(37)-C2)-methylthiotransferase MiaB [Bacteroidales bacterium]
MKNVYIETYGCQMNQADSGIVAKVLTDNGYTLVNNQDDADVILINTCAVRDNAEKRIHNRVRDLQSLKKKHPLLKIGIIGCMAERLKDSLINEDKADVVCGPDAYRDIAALIGQTTGINVALSDEETYEDIVPLEIDSDGISAFISVMRGCENFCSYCVVPYTRGKERSRSASSIIKQAESLFNKGYRDITLLGQNVNSYRFEDNGKVIDFADLLAMTAAINPLLRVRFATSHPKDLSEKLIDTIASHKNICKYIHLPIQSGSDNMLKKMNRKYTVSQYLEKTDLIRRKIPDCALSTDVIAGFCGETEEDHRQTLEIFKRIGYDSAYMFKYSERPGTLASKKYADDVKEEEKVRRLQQIIDLQRELSLSSNKKDIGKTFEVLVEGESKRDKTKLYGRTSQNKVVIFDKQDNKKGDYILVEIENCTSATLFGKKKQ